jgi:hypothetical protein
VAARADPADRIRIAMARHWGATFVEIQKVRHPSKDFLMQWGLVKVFCQ